MKLLKALHTRFVLEKVCFVKLAELLPELVHSRDSLHYGELGGWILQVTNALPIHRVEDLFSKCHFIRNEYVVRGKLCTSSALTVLADCFTFLLVRLECISK